VNASQTVDQAAGNDVITLDRRRGERRGSDEPNGQEQTAGGRRKKQRRRHIDPTTCERDYTNDEIEFMRAMDDYKNRSGRMFPTCSEVLEVVRDLGYVRLTDQERQCLGLDEPAECGDTGSCNETAAADADETDPEAADAAASNL
jgi:hypothetical protein